MRELADAERIRRLMQALGRAAARDGDCYLAGGATAVLIGWRSTTIDVDLRLEPDRRTALRELCRERQPEPPFVVSAKAWVARGAA